MLLVGLWTGSAPAQTGLRIVVFPAEGQGSGRLKKAPAAVTAAVAEAARASGARVEVAAGSVADAATLAGCDAQKPDCLGQVAATVDADIVVSISVAPADSGVFVDLDLGKRDSPEPVRANWILDGADTAAIEKAAAREAKRLFSGDTGPAEPAAEAPADPAAARASAPEPAGAAAAAVARPAEEQPSGLRRVRWYSWAAVGAGAVLMTAGAISLRGASDKQDEIDAASTDSLADFRELESLEDDASAQATRGSILVGAGIVAAAVGVTLVLLQMRDAPDGEGEAESVSLAPTAFEGGAGVTLTLLGDL
ncbi:MAG TPA: hypothetical protein VFU21_26000 [Kofleriaceae bacterium]|nr:hypothetical protein [Kofleriaceae bacterium]